MTVKTILQAGVYYGNARAAYDHSSCHMTMTDVQWLRDENLGVIMGHLPNNISINSPFGRVPGASFLWSHNWMLYMMNCVP